MCLLIYLSFKIDVIYGGILMPSNIVYQQDKKKRNAIRNLELGNLCCGIQSLLCTEWICDISKLNFIYRGSESPSAKRFNCNFACLSGRTRGNTSNVFTLPDIRLLYKLELLSINLRYLLDIHVYLSSVIISGNLLK